MGASRAAALLAGLVSVAVSAGASTTPAGAAGSASASVTFVEGLDPAISSTTMVDVILDGRICALRNVPYGSLGRRLSLPAGVHTLTAVPADGRCTGGAPLASSRVDAVSGGDISVAAGISAAGAMTMVETDGDHSALATDRSRVTVQNATPERLDVAVAPSGTDGLRTDVDLGSGWRFRNDLAAGAYEITVGSDATAVRTPVTFADGAVVTIYLTGVGAQRRVVVDSQLAEDATPGR